MMLSRAPVRFSLGGGGTDLPSYCNEHGGFLVAAAIDKYIYVAANRRFYPSILLKYSKTEQVDRVEDIQHPLFREAMRLTGVSDGLELVSIADQLGNRAVFKRLGFLAERLPGRQNLLAACRGRLSRGTAKLDPSARCPRLVTRWRLWVPPS